MRCLRRATCAPEPGGTVGRGWGGRPLSRYASPNAHRTIPSSPPRFRATNPATYSGSTPNGGLEEALGPVSAPQQPGPPPIDGVSEPGGAVPLPLPARRKDVVPVDEKAVQLVELREVGGLDVGLGERAEVGRERLVALAARPARGDLVGPQRGPSP